MLLFWFVCYSISLILVLALPWWVVQRCSGAESVSARATMRMSVLVLAITAGVSFLLSRLHVHIRGDISVSLLHAFVLSSASALILWVFRQSSSRHQRRRLFLLAFIQFIILPSTTLPLLALYEPSSVSFVRIYFFYGLSILGLFAWHIFQLRRKNNRI
jgi:hypothetical protein